MRVIETRYPVRDLDYTPCGRFLVYAERQNEQPFPRGFARAPLQIHCLDLARWTDSWTATLTGCPRIWLALSANRLAAYNGGVIGGLNTYRCEGECFERNESSTYEMENAYFADYSKDARYLAWNRLQQNGTEIVCQESANSLTQSIFRPYRNIYSVQFSNDAKYVAMTDDTYLTLWSMANHEPVAVWTRPAGEQTNKRSSWVWCRFSPDASKMFVCGRHQSYVWDPLTDHVQIEIPSVPDAMTFSPDGRYLALAKGRAVEIWDASAGTCHIAYEWPVDSISRLAFAPDGLTIAAGGRNGIVIWDVDV